MLSQNHGRVDSEIVREPAYPLDICSDLGGFRPVFLSACSYFPLVTNHKSDKLGTFLSRTCAKSCFLGLHFA